MSTVNKNPHAVALGRLGRKKNTPAQQEAARANGKKGGRPKKSAQEREDEATERMLRKVKTTNKARKLTDSIL